MFPIQTVGFRNPSILFFSTAHQFERSITPQLTLAKRSTPNDFNAENQAKQPIGDKTKAGRMRWMFGLTGPVEMMHGRRRGVQRPRGGQSVQARHGVSPTWRARRGDGRHEVGAAPRHRRPHYWLGSAVGFVWNLREKKSRPLLNKKWDTSGSLLFFSSFYSYLNNICLQLVFFVCSNRCWP